MMNNKAPENGDFAAYLKNLDNLNKQGQTNISNVLSDPATSSTLPAFPRPHSENITDQDLTELPPISDDDLLKQALACEGDSNEYNLDESVEDLSNDGGMVAQVRSHDEPKTVQADLAFLGDHALELADQPTPEELNDLPPITDEELIQQALANTGDNEDISSE